jgi:hypothetical protein
MCGKKHKGNLRELKRKTVFLFSLLQERALLALIRD